MRRALALMRSHGNWRVPTSAREGGWPLQDTVFVHYNAILQYSIILVLPPPSALLTLLQYYRTTIAQYTTPHPTPLLNAIHHTILAVAISCKGQGGGGGWI